MEKKILNGFSFVGSHEKLQLQPSVLSDCSQKPIFEILKKN
jgi:hypothetical protein